MEQMRDRLIDAAGMVFAQRGYRAATIREICHKADANVAAVNYYFGDKRRLYSETVKAASRKREEEVPFPVWNSETSPADKLRDFVRTILIRMLGQDSACWESRLMLREVLSPTEAGHELVEEYFRPTFELLLDLIRQLAPNLSAKRCRQIGLSVMGQCLIYRAASQAIEMITSRASPDDQLDLEQLAEHISSFSLAAMGHARPLTATTNPNWTSCN